MDGQRQISAPPPESAQAPPPAAHDRRALVLLVCCLAAAGILFTRHSVLNALWMDELFSLMTAGEPPREMVRLLSSYHPGSFDHPPLYFLLLRTVAMLSDAPLVLRLPSMVFAAAAAAIVGSFSGRGSAGIAGRLACAMAFLTMVTVADAATFVRMYALVVLASAGLLSALRRGIEGTRREALPWLALSACLMSALVYTSYFALLLAVGVAGTAAVCLAMPRAREAAARILLAGAVASVLSLGWVPAIVRMSGHETRGAAEPVARVLQTLKVLFDMSGGNAVGVAFLVAGWTGTMMRERGRGFLCAAFAAGFLVPLLLLAVLSPPQRVIHARYVIFAIPVLYAGAACGVSHLLRRLPRPELAFAALLSVVAAANAWTSARTVLVRVPDWWRVAETIEAGAAPREIIMTGLSMTGEALVYHLREPERFSFLHYQTDLDAFYVAARDPRIVWYVNSSPLPPPYEAIVNRYFPWRADVVGNRPMGTIMIAAKRPFAVPGQGDAPYHEPVPLSYEQQPPQ